MPLILVKNRHNENVAVQTDNIRYVKRNQKLHFSTIIFIDGDFLEIADSLDDVCAEEEVITRQGHV